MIMFSFGCLGLCGVVGLVVGCSCVSILFMLLCRLNFSG